MSTPPVEDELLQILEGYYRWMCDSITDSVGVNRILGTGSAPLLKPSEAKAAIRAYVEREKCELTYDLLALPEWSALDGRQAHVKKLRDALWRKGLNNEQI